MGGTEVVVGSDARRRGGCHDDRRTRPSDSRSLDPQNTLYVGVRGTPRLRRRSIVLLLLALSVEAALGAGCIALNMPGRSSKGVASATGPPDRAEVRERLEADIRALAERIGERNLAHPEALDAAADHIRAALESAGYEVREQPFEAPGFTLPGGREVPGKTVRNLEARTAAGDASSGVIVVGAHYDTVLGSPGADDNGSGVAALLELARRVRNGSARREIRFVFFVNEEMPFFGEEGMGSLAYAQRCKDDGERVVTMLSLETLGYYAEGKGSQRLPWYLKPFYPNRGNFVAFVTHTGHRGLLRRTVGTFRRNAEVPSRGAAVPRSIEGVSWSDHWSFWQMGYPALMVTDTAFLRNPHYHSRDDTPDTLDLDRLAGVVLGLAPTIEELAR